MRKAETEKEAKCFFIENISADTNFALETQASNFYQKCERNKLIFFFSQKCKKISPMQNVTSWMAIKHFLRIYSNLKSVVVVDGGGGGVVGIFKV